MVIDQWMAALHFNEADLETNRQGQMSETQKKRLQAEERSIKAWSLVGGVVMVALTLGGLYFTIKVSIHSGWQAGILFDLGVLLGALFCWILLQRVFSSPDLKVSRAEGMAKIVEATRYDVQSHRNTTYHELRIGSQRFMVSSAVKELLQNEKLILYYIDRTAEHPLDPSILYTTRDILSIEALNTEEGKSS